MAELCVLWKVRKSHTTLYLPQANVMLERSNRDLSDMLKNDGAWMGQKRKELTDTTDHADHQIIYHKQMAETANYLMLE